MELQTFFVFIGGATIGILSALAWASRHRNSRTLQDVEQAARTLERRAAGAAQDAGTHAVLGLEHLSKHLATLLHSSVPSAEPEMPSPEEDPAPRARSLSDPPPR